MPDSEQSDGTPGPGEEPPAPPPLLVLRDGLPRVVETAEGLAEACAAISSGTGPVAIDAERASGYRYSSRAYLIQLRREGAGTWLVDPIAFDSLAPLSDALQGLEWVLHAATQDIPSLAEVGLRPHSLFDTELAGRLLGYPRVGLATLVETVLGERMKKEHSAADWSTRPLPGPWLEYAALDVEPLLELRAALEEQLVAAGKDEWARQEFDHLLSFEVTPRVDAWRRTSGLHKIRGRRGLGAVKALWELRDELAERRDVTPGRIIPDSAIVAAAQALPQDRDALMSVPGFHGRGAERYAARWVAALRSVASMEESELPTRAARADGPPLPRAWADRDPVAARRLALAREAMAELAEQHQLPVENLLTPDHLRRLLWAPPATRDPDSLAAAVAVALSRLGARRWQVELTAPLVTQAILEADQPAPAEPPAQDEEAEDS
jgi:ribonuclease D